MSTSVDYYDTLGLQSSATHDEIKKRYRELARKYHPDVNSSPDAAQKIKAVNEAHRVLGDLDRRSLYDAERALNPPPPKPARPEPQRPQPAQKAAAKPFGWQSQPKSAPQSQPRTNQARPKAGPTVEFNGFGRAFKDGDDSTGPGRKQTTRPTAPDHSELVQRLVSEAEIAFLTRNYIEATRLCREAIDKDSRAPGAHEVLGDIYAVRGLTESAIKSYSYAIQFDPRNYGAQGKLDRLIGRKPSTTRTIVSRRTTGNRSTQPIGHGNREAAMMLISLALFGGGCLALAAYGQNPGAPLGGAIPWVTSLSTNLIITLIVEGIIAGVLLAFYGRLKPISDELSGVSKGGLKRAAPLLSILALFSIVWFYASLIVCIIVAATRNRLSISTVRVYGAVLTLVVLFTIMAAASERGGAGWLETAAFSGNVLFPGALLGWYLGDCVRLRGK